MPPKQQVDGVLLLDKPAGVTSNAALQRARRALGAAKAGHTGTLDPLASGLLPLCFGEATKFAQVLLDARKRYRATVRLGVTTTTQDAEGDIVATRPVLCDRHALEAALSQFVGEIDQVPPAYSALKRQGRSYYEYARAGIAIEREARTVTIDSLALVDWQAPDAVIDVACSKGTYVRTLGADLGERLGCGAHLAALRRTASGSFTLDQAVSLPDLESMDVLRRREWLLPPDRLLAGAPRIDLDSDSASRFCNGVPVDFNAPDADACAVYCRDSFLGLAGIREGIVRPRRLVAGAGLQAD